MKPILTPQTETSPKTIVSDDRYAGMRRAIAAALGKSKREIPHYYLSQAIDMSKALSWLEEENLKRPITERVVPALLLLKASALAAKDVPDLNGFWKDEGFMPSEAVHLGVGISLRQGGLIAPCIHDADKKDLNRLMADLRDLVKRARKLQLKSSEMTDATLTVTNLGDQGVESVYGIIYPPQVALLGFGKVKEQAWAENGMVGARPIVQTTLAGDHRASDGHVGGLFLMAINKYLQTPEAL
jgi:pyruvate dehydrogenase E2 component (dihydrolipoamide acetyltransferase)